MRRLRRTTPPDRRAARLMTLVTPHDRPAADAGTATAGLPVRGLDALASVLATYGAERLVGPGSAREADLALRDAAARLVAEARAEDPVRAERLLVALRHAWQALPAVQQVHDTGDHRALWDKVVRLCCEEFYRPDAAHAAAPRRFGAT